MGTQVTQTYCVLFLLAMGPAAGAQQAGQGGVQPADSGQGTLHIVPKNGQTEQQLWSDRYACSDWAKTQSGFDPAAPAGPAEEAAVHSEQYRRALTACLEARGYAVSYGAPAPVAPAAAAGAATAHEVHVTSNRTLRYHPWAVQLNAGYALTEGSLKPNLNDGGTVGIGFRWFPSSTMPVAVRIDASYSQFEYTLAARDAASAVTGTNIVNGYQNLYGGDADLQLDLMHGSRAKAYVFGGVGRYRQQNVLEANTLVYGLVCGFYYCVPGYFPVLYTAARSTTEWLKSWNAGFGMEFALSDPATFFIEARYLRVSPHDVKQEYIPITLGLRF
jgi:opacity protein-like surface antigen